MNESIYLTQFKTNSENIIGSFWGNRGNLIIIFNSQYSYYIEDDICSVCHRQKRNITTGDNCSHSFCYECILKWCQVDNICPLCKKKL